MDRIHLVTARGEDWDWSASGGLYESMLWAYCLDVVIDEFRTDEHSWRQAGKDYKCVRYALIVKANVSLIICETVCRWFVELRTMMSLQGCMRLWQRRLAAAFPAAHHVNIKSPSSNLRLPR